MIITSPVGKNMSHQKIELDAYFASLLEKYDVSNYNSGIPSKHRILCEELVTTVKQHCDKSNLTRADIKSHLIGIIESFIKNDMTFFNYVNKVISGQTFGMTQISGKEFDEICRAYAIQIVGEVLK
jgi:hypothetical protein